MASFREVIREEKENLIDGIAWIVFYKEGRSWESESFWNTDGDYDNGLIFDEDDLLEMKRIMEVDPKAICINGYYMGYGEDMTLHDIEDKVLWTYLERLNQLNGDFIGGLVVEK